MPELSASRTGYRAASITSGERQSPLVALRRNYQHPGDPEEPGPPEIVAELHKRIAAQSPDLARLVAAYERKQEERSRERRVNVLKTERQQRVREYGNLLDDGWSPVDAAREVRVSLKTAGTYARELRRTAGVPS